MAENEETLAGGWATAVTRTGHVTVQSAKPQSRTVLSFLFSLASEGIAVAPRTAPSLGTQRTGSPSVVVRGRDVEPASRATLRLGKVESESNYYETFILRLNLVCFRPGRKGSNSRRGSSRSECVVSVTATANTEDRAHHEGPLSRRREAARLTSAANHIAKSEECRRSDNCPRCDAIAKGDQDDYGRNRERPARRREREGPVGLR